MKAIIKIGEWKLFGARTVGLTLYPYIFLRKSYFDRMPKIVLDNTIRHETIHIKQQAELLVLPFYIWYVVEYVIKFFKYGAYAYENLSFEREAYQNEKDENYLSTRKPWSFIKYLTK
ncbi:MAG: hypothetical protein WCP46_00050 [Alphaproteobacteria bacterium]